MEALCFWLLQFQDPCPVNGGMRCIKMFVVGGVETFHSVVGAAMFIPREQRIEFSF